MKEHWDSAVQQDVNLVGINLLEYVDIKWNKKVIWWYLKHCDHPIIKKKKKPKEKDSSDFRKT